MIVGLLVTVHLCASIFLILIVLLQTGKGQDLASAFGGGGAQAVFGASGAATFLHKLTVASAIIFMCTSLTLSILSSAPSDSVISNSAMPPQNVDIPIQAPITGDTGKDTESVPITGDQSGSSTKQEETGADTGNTAPVENNTQTEEQPAADTSDDSSGE